MLSVKLENIQITIYRRNAFLHWKLLTVSNLLFWHLAPPAFTCHDHGATVLQYAPKHQLLISGGRKGYICIFDIRQRQILSSFQAHESAVKALALDPSEDYFVTGSAEGNMKVRYGRTELHRRVFSTVNRQMNVVTTQTNPQTYIWGRECLPYVNNVNWTMSFWSK